jgi:hypothetical protein
MMQKEKKIRKKRMMKEILVAGEKYKESDQPLRLLDILRRHIDKKLILPESVHLSDREVLTIKTWLLQHAESMRPGKAVWIEEKMRNKSRLVVAIGRTDEGSPIVWHEHLPWPFNFDGESEFIRNV